MRSILAALLLVALGGRAQENTSSTLTVQFVDAGGLDAVRSRSAGKVLVLNFWATWCTPCVEEFPELVKVQREYRRRGVDVVFVSIDDDADAQQKVTTFLKKMRVAGISYLKTPGDDEKFINAVDRHWGGAVPITLFYDTRGRLAETRYGALNYFEIEKIILPLLSR